MKMLLPMILLTSLVAPLGAHAANVAPMIKCDEDFSKMIVSSKDKKAKPEETEKPTMGNLMLPALLKITRIKSTGINKEIQLQMTGPRIDEFSGDLTGEIGFADNFSDTSLKNQFVKSPVLVDKNTRIQFEIMDSNSGTNLTGEAATQSSALIQNLQAQGLTVTQGKFPGIMASAKFLEMNGNNSRPVQISAEATEAAAGANIGTAQIVGVQGIVSFVQLNGISVVIYSFQGDLGLSLGKENPLPKDFRKTDLTFLGMKILGKQDADDSKAVAALKSLNGKVCQMPQTKVHIFADQPAVKQAAK